MNKDEYYILVDIADQLGKDDPKTFIDDRLNGSKSRIRGKTILCNQYGNVISVDLSGYQLKGQIPSSIGKLVHLKELRLNDNKLTGTIPSSIGDLIHLKELRLSRNQLVGTIPSSIGGLVDLKHLHVDGNRQLTGALPPIVSKECSINTNDTNISRVEIKTKPLRQWYDYGFVVTHVFLGYIDLCFDIIAILALSTDVPIMIANILFIVLNVSLGVWMSRDDTVGIIRVIFQLDQFYQAYKTMVDKHQTHGLVVSKKLDAITRSMPSMILQLYGLLKTETNKQLLLMSIGSSIIGAGCTLASLSPNSGSNLFSRNFIIHYAYYVVEIMLRVTILGMMFYAVKLYGFIVAGVDFMIRLFLGYSESQENFRDAVFLAIQSFGSDHTVLGQNNKILYIGFLINTVEMIIVLIVLHTLNTDAMVWARSNGYITTLTATLCVTWLIRVIFIWSGALDRITIPIETMVLKEEKVIKDDTNTV